ncbi:hypothetical protein L3X38_024312 [Prunus dulcis]|uniref:Uncharacterized protein n=1 Tax=Prunus dulcis TaxID=3755 RepID=A0AAD4Z6D3_PRUDU|nr:hypothetical protein L3X38_024312 [Prunus dulcis]
MTGASSSSNPSRLPPPAAVVSPENGEEAAGVVRTSPPSISLLRPPNQTSKVEFLGNVQFIGETLPKFWQKVSYPYSILGKKGIALEVGPTSG